MSDLLRKNAAFPLIGRFASSRLSPWRRTRCSPRLPAAITSGLPTTRALVVRAALAAHTLEAGHHSPNRLTRPPQPSPAKQHDIPPEAIQRVPPYAPAAYESSPG